MAKQIARIVSRNVKPRHEHDCEKCIFLGHLNDLDIYKCGKNRNLNYIARFGDDGQYGCTPENVVKLLPEGSAPRFAFELDKRKNPTPNAYSTLNSEKDDISY